MKATTMWFPAYRELGIKFTFFFLFVVFLTKVPVILFSRLQSLISSSPVMIFMKGSPDVSLLNVISGLLLIIDAVWHLALCIFLKWIRCNSSWSFYQLGIPGSWNPVWSFWSCYSFNFSNKKLLIAITLIYSVHFCSVKWQTWIVNKINYYIIICIYGELDAILYLACQIITTKFV